MYNHELTLIGYRTIKDEIGNEVTEPVYTDVLCKVSSIGQKEFYDAAISNLKPEMKFIIHDFEYEGQREVEFKGIRYKVMRTFQGRKGRNNTNLDFDEIELTCEKVVGNG